MFKDCFAKTRQILADLEDLSSRVDSLEEKLQSLRSTVTDTLGHTFEDAAEDAHSSDQKLLPRNPTSTETTA